MSYFFYILIAIISLFVAKYEKRINVALISAPISVPLGFFTAIGLIIVLKLLFFVLAIIFMILSKIKILVKLKIGAILGAIAVSLIGGPIGWVISALLIFFILAGIQEAFISIYEWFFKKMAEILMSIRKTFISFRKTFPIFLHPIIILVEVFLVCGLSLNSLWSLMDLVDGKIEITTTVIQFRLLVLLPYALILYRNYIKDTKPPNTGGEGVDSPLLVEFTDFIDFIF